MAALLLIFFIPRVVSAEEIIIFHTNDSHSRILNSDEKGKAVGLAEMAAAVKTTKAKSKNVFWFDAGDTFHSMPRINISNGENMIPLLNAAGVDVMAPGNHDFNYGSDQLQNISKKLKFPVLAANVVQESNGAKILPSYKILKYGKIKIGVFGLTTPETIYKSSIIRFSKLEFLNPVETARDMIKILRPQCDILVAVMHMGILDDSLEFTSERIARETEGIDLIIDGHSHTELPQGLNVKNTLIVQTGCYEHYLGQVNINFSDGKIISKTAKLLSADDVKRINPTPDKKIVNAVIKMEKRNKKILDLVVAYSDKSLTDKRNIIRRQESEIGDLCADAFRWKSGADFAIMNCGGIRAGLPAGNITRGNILEVMPFGNLLKKVEIDGKTIRKMLENSVSGYPGTPGGFLAVSGMSFTFDPSQPSGQRVQEIFVGSELLDENKIYTMGGVDFLLIGGDDYTMLKDLKVIGVLGTIDDVFVEYLNRNGTKETEFGRIRNLQDAEIKKAA